MKWVGLDFKNGHNFELKSQVDVIAGYSRTCTLESTQDTPLDHHDNTRPASNGFTRRSLADVISGPRRDSVVSVVACVGVVSVGLSLGYSSPALQDKHVTTLLSDTACQSWFGSLLIVGAMAGAPLGALLVGRLGRKPTLILGNLPLVVGWFLIIYAADAGFLYAGRYAQLKLVFVTDRAREKLLYNRSCPSLCLFTLYVS